MISPGSESPADPEQQAPERSSSEFNKTVITPGDTAPNSLAPLSTQGWIGRRLGKYTVTGLLGAGGMGVVLRAHDPAIERDVAIKVLTPELSRDPAALNRFLAEAKSAGKLNHPNVVTVYEVGQQEEANYLVMELVTGGSVEGHIEKSGAYPVPEATRLMIEACQGLSAAHAAGLVHRDVKPANLLLTDHRSMKVTDFGLAKRTQNQALQVTRAGQVVGTPYFMSPEQCESREVDVRSDIYSLGATYYALLTGRNPFEESGSVIQVMFAHCHSDRPDPRHEFPGIPMACTQIIQRAMATNPNERYQSMKELQKDLEALLSALSGTGVLLPSQSAENWSPVHQRESGASRHWILIGGMAALISLTLGLLTYFNGFSRHHSTLDARGAASDQEQAVPAILPPPVGEPIKVGIIHSQTGTMARSAAPLIDTALLAIDEINRSGGLLGRPVKAIIADGKSNSDIFAGEIRRLIEKEQVCTIFGCWTSASRKTVAPILEELDHLLVYPLTYEGIEESPNIIYVGSTPNQVIIPAVKWAYAFEGKRRFYVVGSDFVFPRVAFEIVKDELQELGAELVGNAFLPLGSNRVDPVVKDIVNSRPDVILNLINGDTNVAFFSGLRAAGISPQEIPTISFNLEEQQLQQLTHSEMHGDYAAWNYFQSIDSPENHVFVAAFHQKSGAERVISDPMEASYFGVKLWAQAVEDAQALTPPAIRRAMRNQRMKAPQGEVRIDPPTQHTFLTPRIGQIRSDGQFDVVWTAARPEVPQPYPPSRTSEEWRALLHDLYLGWNNQWEAAPE